MSPWPLALCLVLLAPVCSQAAAASPPAAEGWELAFEEDDVRVYRRFLPDSDVVETFTLARIEAPPERVFSVLTDHGRYHEFMPHIVESRLVSQAGDTQLIFQRLRISDVFRFLFKDRYHVVRNRLHRPPEGASHYRVEWSLDTAAMRDLRVDDAIATRLNSGYWDLQGLDGGSATRVEYYLRADPGGSIPKSFAHAGILESIPAVIDAVRTQAISTTRPGFRR
jgi:hypothetical protein